MNQEKIKSAGRENREQMEHQLMLQMTQKAESVKKLKLVLDSLDLEMDIGEVVNRLHDYFDEVKAQYPGILPKLAYFHNLELEAADVSASIAAFLKAYGEEKIDDLLVKSALNELDSLDQKDYEVAKNITSLYAAMDDVRGKIDDLFDDDVLLFLSSLQKGIDNAIRRFQQIKKLEKNPEELKTEIGALLKIPPEEQDKIKESIVDIEFNPIAINIYVSDSFFDKYISPKSEGVHYLKTPFNFIKDSRNDSELAEIVSHEETHSFTDCFLSGYAQREKYKAEFWVKSLQTQIETLDALIEQDALSDDPKITSSRDFSINIPYFGSIKNLIDSLHEEIIADFQRVQYQELFVDFEKIKSSVVFTTAHNDALSSIEGLNELRKIAKSPMLKKKLEGMFVSIGDYMNRIVYQMNKAYLIGSVLGADKDVEALLVTLKPSQYHHLKRFLINKYGKEKYQQAEEKIKLQHAEKLKMLNLEQKVDSVKKLKTIMDMMSLDMNLEELTKSLYEHLDGVKAQYPDLAGHILMFDRAKQNLRKAEAEYEQMFHVHDAEMLHDLMDRVKLHGDEELTPKEKTLVAEVVKRELEVQKQQEFISALLQDRDLAFIMCTQNGIEELIEKFQEIKYIQKTPGRILVDIRNILNLPQSASSEIEKAVIKVEYKPYCINVFLEEEFFEDHVSDRSVGIHYMDTPINFIIDDDDKDQVRKTVDHEQVHALLSGFLPEHLVDKDNVELESLMQQFKTEIETRDKLLQQGIDVDKKISLPFYGTENKFIDAQHEEMLADIDHVRSIKVGRIISNDELLEAFSSAGEQMLIMSEILVMLYHKVKNPGLKAQLEELIENLDKKFQKVAFHMNHSLLIGAELGSQFDIEALLVLLRPTQFELTKKYLVHLHGIEACKQASEKLFGPNPKTKVAKKSKRSKSEQAA